MSSRFALRILSGALLLMALMDVPAAVDAGSGRLLAALLLLGLFITLLFIRARAEGPPARVRVEIRKMARAATVLVLIGGIAFVAWLELAWNAVW
jgi:hypothetical protein